jgi:putative transposase
MIQQAADNRSNQVWATNTSYIPMAKEFVYLVAMVDWFSRKALMTALPLRPNSYACVNFA